MQYLRQPVVGARRRQARLLHHRGCREKVAALAGATPAEVVFTAAARANGAARTLGTRRLLVSTVMHRRRCHRRRNPG
ncbi:MAG: hypothetical protein U1E35_06765 [Rhodospirillales bacterium]